MKTRQNNELSDHIGRIYEENETEFLIHAQLVYSLLIGVQSIGVLWFQSLDGSNQQNL